jgi:hypothetical protein
MTGYHSRRLIIGAGVTFFSILFLARGAFAQFSAGSLLKGAAGQMGGRMGSLGAGLGQSEISGGLKEMLKVTAREAIGKVGKPNGFSGDPAVRIPLPGVLEQARQPLSMMGQGAMLNDLSQRMNRGAEQAAPKALGIFNKAAANVSFDDARQILTGPQDSATQYFKRSCTGELTTAFTPIMGSALKGSGAMKTMDSVRQRVGGGGNSMMGALGGLAQQAGMGQSGMVSSLMNFDLTGFAVGAALQGVFHYMGQEEADIRSNPVARTTPLLKKLFG